MNTELMAAREVIAKQQKALMQVLELIGQSQTDLNAKLVELIGNALPEPEWPKTLRRTTDL